MIVHYWFIYLLLKVFRWRCKFRPGPTGSNGVVNCKIRITDAREADVGDPVKGGWRPGEGRLKLDGKEGKGERSFGGFVFAFYGLLLFFVVYTYWLFVIGLFVCFF